MGDLGTPQVLVSGNADVHHISLRPSQASSLAAAQLLVWIGPELTPWLVKAVDALPRSTVRLGLLALPETTRIENNGVDPHVWLDPDNAIRWLQQIAAALAGLDPDHATDYARNATRAADRITEVAARIEQTIPRPALLLTSHDALEYFARRFDVTQLGAVTDTEAAPPSAQHLAELHRLVAKTPPDCAIIEPGQDSGVLGDLLGDRAVPVTAFDPLGSSFEQGPALYGELLQSLADILTNCTE
jgi:zinc transport system substrate-binding protein